MSMKLFGNAIFVYRNYSTKSNWVSNKGFKGGNELKKNNPRIKWTDEQNQVLGYAGSGLSLFITGSAGTGKTVLLKQIIRMMQKAYGKSGVYVTASTGVAACALRGQTLHSFAGIGMGNGDRVMLLDRVLSDRSACRRWRKAQALVIDEISMLDGELFDNLEYIAKHIRGSDRVWGGIRLVVIGDFLQLPPIPKQHDPSHKEFAFEADCWDKSFDKQVELTKNFRQSEPKLVKLLEGIRRDNIDPEDLLFLQQSCSASEPDPSAVQLYPRIDDVNKVNTARMKALSGKKVIYKAIDEGKRPGKRQLASGLVPDRLVLCEGARVMLVKNLNVFRRLVNGATGVVTGFIESKRAMAFTPDNRVPIVKFDSGLEVVIEPEKWCVMEGSSVIASRMQLPLILAWAISIHKCQGMSLDRLHTNLSRAFGYGMVYVALSRVTSLDGLYLSGFCPSKIKAHPKVLQFYSRFDHQQQSEGGNDAAVADENKHNGKSLLSASDGTSSGHKYAFSLKEFLVSQERKTFSLKSSFTSAHKMERRTN